MFYGLGTRHTCRATLAVLLEQLHVKLRCGGLCEVSGVLIRVEAHGRHTVPRCQSSCSSHVSWCAVWFRSRGLHLIVHGLIFRHMTHTLCHVGGPPEAAACYRLWSGLGVEFYNSSCMV